MLLTRSPLSRRPKPPFALDLHVLGTPPALILSQDQTLQLKHPESRKTPEKRDATPRRSGREDRKRHTPGPAPPPGGDGGPAVWRSVGPARRPDRRFRPGVLRREPEVRVRCPRPLRRAGRRSAGVAEFDLLMFE